MSTAGWAGTQHVALYAALNDFVTWDTVGVLT